MIRFPVNLSMSPLENISSELMKDEEIVKLALEADPFSYEHIPKNSIFKNKYKKFSKKSKATPQARRLRYGM